MTKFFKFLIMLVLISLFLKGGADSRYKIEAAENETIKELTELITTNPTNPSAYFERGKEYANLNSLGMVTSTYINPSQYPPSYSQMEENRKIILQNEPIVELAISDFTKAIELNPEYLDALRYRAVMYFLISDIEKSLKDAKTLYNLGHPANPKFLGALLGEAAKRGIKIE